MKQTAVEWFAQQLGITSGSMLEKAKEMEKQQIIKAYTNGSPEFFDMAEEYYSETYGSKNIEKSEKPINLTSSQTELSDEEIEEIAEREYPIKKDMDRELWSENNAFKKGIKLYREQLKQRQ